MQTVLGTFDDKQTAQRAVDQLLADGFDRGSVHVQSGSWSDGRSSGEPSANKVMSAVGSFFSNLFDSDNKVHAGNYAEAVRRGSSVVAVDATTDLEVNRAQMVLQRLGSVNVDDRAAQWKSKGWAGFDPELEPMSDDEIVGERSSIPVVQEDVVVGKRTVDVGGLRVVKRLSETPVSKILNLRQEKATVQRTATDRPATEDDFANFREGTFEIRETAEEAVIAKTARVVEEVSVSRDVTNRAETIFDTVRRTDVEVERTPAAQAQNADEVK